MYNTVLQDQQSNPELPDQQTAQQPQQDNRQMMLAKMIAGGQPLKNQAQQYVNGWAVKQNPLAGVGDMVRQMSQSYMQNQAGQMQPLQQPQQSFPVSPQGQATISPLGY